MKKLLLLTLSSFTLLGACSPQSTKEETKETTSSQQPTTKEVKDKTMIVTDVGGVDDKSFNQSAWEGLQKFAKENSLEKGEDYDYLQSNSDSDYITNLTSAVGANYNLIFGIGYKLAPAIEEVAKQYPDNHFVIIDSVVKSPNVTSITFLDNEASFLAGVAAAKTTKTNKVGFIGGVEGEVIERFEAGFIQGVATVNPDIEVHIQYAGSFTDSAKGKQLAATLYSNDVDVIFHASGAVGNGVFAEAKDIVTNDPSKDIWVIGVDLDQSAEGWVEINGKERNITLASTLKGVGEAVYQSTKAHREGNLESGFSVLGLKENGVGLTTHNLSEEAKKAVEYYKEKIINEEIKVSEKLDSHEGHNH